MQIVHARDGLAFESHDHIAFAQSCALCRTGFLHRQDERSALFLQIVEPHHAVNRNSGRCERTRPAESISGPPEFPGFNDASVWMTSSISRPEYDRSDRPSALTTPAVTVD